MKKTSSEVALVRPAMETLLDGAKGSLWPSAILKDPRLTAEIDLRSRILAALEALFEAMPDPSTDLATALDAGQVDAKKLSDTYGLLADFLTDPGHARLVLYFPFELLLPAEHAARFEELAETSLRFKESYLASWRGLLDESDVRANFVDGDILEPELAPSGQARVVKAAHLIPQLALKGWLRRSEVARIRTTARDTLRESIDDALAFLAEPMNEPRLPQRPFERADGRQWLTGFVEELLYERKKLDMRATLDHERGLPQGRIAWERKDREEKLISQYGEYVARALGSEILSYENLLSEVAAEPYFVRSAVIHGIGQAVLKRARLDPLSARILAFVMRIRLRGFERSEYETVLRHWRSQDLLLDEELRDSGLNFPDLAANFDEKGPLAEEITGFVPSIRTIIRTPELARMLYPAAIFFGSRLKGYAKDDADLDAAVFVRPGTDPKDRTALQAHLAATFESEKIDGKIVEFWLEESGGGLRIREFPDPDVFLADDTWVHLLLAGVWLGEKTTLKELHHRLLPGFLRPDGRTIDGLPLRTIRLREMEREVLQYRLMHKGYRRFFPPAGGIQGSGASRLGPGAFWDPGYRRLATRLFMKKVCLPEVSG